MCVCVVFECVGGRVFRLFKFVRRRIAVNKGVQLKRYRFDLLTVLCGFWVHFVCFFSVYLR